MNITPMNISNSLNNLKPVASTPLSAIPKGGLVIDDEAIKAMRIHMIVQLIRMIEGTTGKTILPAFVNYGSVDINQLLDKLRNS